MRTYDTGEHPDSAAQENPREAVDAIEERVLGTAPGNDEETSSAPAIEQDLDSDELGTAAAGDEPSA